MVYYASSHPEFRLCTSYCTYGNMANIFRVFIFLRFISRAFRRVMLCLMWFKQEQVVSVDFQVGFVSQPFWVFFLIFILQCNIVILCSLHRYGEYWRPRSQSYCRYFGSYATRNLNVFQSIGCQLTVCESKRSHLVWLFSFILFRKVLFINFYRYWVFCTHILPGNLCSYCP